MSTESTTSHERGESDEETAQGVLARAKRVAGNGSGALLAGGTLLAGALRARGRGGRTALQGLAGIALVGVGLKQRRAGDEEIEDPSSKEHSDDDVSAEADAAIQLHDVDQQAEGNPRDVSNEPDVETHEDEGDIQFSDEQDIDPRKEPDLEDEEGVSDTRRNDVGEEEEAEVEVDISEAAMADEPNEAAGPSPKQAQPTTEDGETVPDDASELKVDPDDHEVDESGADDGDDSEGDGEDRETVESEGGSTVHTDTMESGTIDIDEDEVTDPDDDLNEEPADSDEQSSPRLDDGDDENESED